MAISIAKLAIHLATDTSQMVAGFSRAKALTQGFAGTMQGGTSAMAGFSASGLLVTTGLTALTAAASAFVYQGVKFAATMQMAEASLTGFTGSTGTAKAMLADLFEFAAKTPFEVNGVVAAAKTMMAMGAESEDVMAQMEMLGEVAAGSQQPLNELANVFGQVMQAGRLTGNELRQFNERGIPLLTQLAENMGKTKEEIRAMVEAGQIGATDVVEAFDKMTTGSGIFAGQMSKQSQTLIGQWSTFKDNMSALAGDVMQTLVPAMTELLRTLNSIIDALRSSKENMAMFMSGFGGLGMVLGAMHLMREDGPQGKGGANNSRQQYLEKLKLQEAELKAAKASKEAFEEAAKTQERLMDSLRAKADSLTQSLRTPGEVWKDSMTEINALMQEGLINWDTYTRAIEQATQKLHEQADAKAGLDRASSNPALLQGTQAFITATRGGQTNIEKLHTEAQKQTALHKHAEQQRKEMIAAMKDNRPANIIPINF